MTEENQAPQENETSSAAEAETKKRPLEEDLKEYKDKYLRLLAEMENVRKRMQKEKQEATRFAVEGVITDILGPIDNMENALKIAEKMSDEVRNWAIGFQMILGQFKDVIQDQGITHFPSEGMIFDPHKHEAVEMEETQLKPEGTIIQEFVKGYKCGDRIVRPARVKVAKAPSKETVESLSTNQKV